MVQYGAYHSTSIKYKGNLNFVQGFTQAYGVLKHDMEFNSLMVCVVQLFAAPTPTTFSAATDTLSKLEGGFEGGSKV